MAAQKNADPLFEPLITLLLKMVFNMAVAEGFEPPDGFSRLSLSRRVR
jgi:hypothetical protein